MAPGTEPGHSAIVFFRSELLSEKITTHERVNTIRRLKLVANIVGQQRIRNNIVPLLNEASEQFRGENEFLFALAEELGDLCDTLGEAVDANDASLLRIVRILEKLVDVDETVVREKAVESLSRIVDKIPAHSRFNFCVDHLMVLFETLSRGQWFTSRVSACNLFIVTYKHVAQHQHDMRRSFCTMCHDDTPMVRRAAAAKMKDLFAQADVSDILTHFVNPQNSIVQSFWCDDTQDGLRCCVLDALMELWPRLSPSDETSIESIASKIMQAKHDRSWRVRLKLAKNLNKILAPSSTKCISAHLLSGVTDVLIDSEMEVRKAALTSLESSFHLMTVDQLTSHIVPVIQTICQDVQQVVKPSLGSALCRLVVLLGRDSILKSQFLLTIQQFLQDSYPVVRLNVASHAVEILEVLGNTPEGEEMTQTFKSLIGDPLWRIRLSVVEQIPRLATKMGVVGYTNNLESTFLLALTDNVSAVRRCAIDGAKKLTESFGSAWMLESLLPKIVEGLTGCSDTVTPFQWKAGQTTLVNSSGQPVSYLSRIALLHALLHLAVAPTVTTGDIESVVVPVLCAAMLDSVANVRFEGAKAAMELMSKGRVTSSTADTVLKPRLTELLEDRDVDVRFFAVNTLHAV